MQVNKQFVLAVALLVVVAAAEGGVPGTIQPVRQLAAWALQVIMQFVAVEVCASRIFASAANTLGATALIAATARRIARPRMTASATHMRRRP